MMKKTFLSLAAAASAISFSSCANPYAPGATNQQRDTATGALLGGAAGAIIGHQSGKGREGALIGAGAGALLGNHVGRQKDTQQYYQR